MAFIPKIKKQRAEITCLDKHLLLIIILLLIENSLLIQAVKRSRLGLRVRLRNYQLINFHVL